MQLIMNDKCVLIEKESEEYIELIETPCSITWSLCNDQFFLRYEDNINYIFSDSGYPNGTNDLYLYNGTYEDWCKELNIPFGRDKGYRTPKSYFGIGVQRMTNITEIINRIDKGEFYKTANDREIAIKNFLSRTGIEHSISKNEINELIELIEQFVNDALLSQT